MKLLNVAHIFNESSNCDHDCDGDGVNEVSNCLINQLVSRRIQESVQRINIGIYGLKNMNVNVELKLSFI